MSVRVIPDGEEKEVVGGALASRQSWPGGRVDPLAELGLDESRVGGPRWLAVNLARGLDHWRISPGLQRAGLWLAGRGRSPAGAARRKSRRRRKEPAVGLRLGQRIPG
jgi:hypothetical protein